MQLTALRYFHETAKSGSIRKAAEALHVAPSAVSRQIMALEREFDAPLFERSTQGVRLTAAGELLARHTQRTFRDLDRVRGWIDDLKGLRRGHVTAYVIEGLVAEFLPRVISEFRMAYPQITFTIITAATDRIIDALVRDEADVAIAFNAPERPDVVRVMEHVEPLKCLVSADHPLAEAAALELKDLVGHPMALPDASFGLRQMLDAAFRRQKAVPKLAINTNSLELTKKMALCGGAIAFMPAVTIMQEIAEGKIRAIPIRSRDVNGAKTTVCVHRDRELPFAATEFLKYLSAGFARLAES